MRANTTLADAIPAMAPGDKCAVVGGVSTLIGDWIVVVVGFVLPEPSAVLLRPSSVGNPWPGITMKSDFFAAAFWMSSDTEEFWSWGGLGSGDQYCRLLTRRVWRGGEIYIPGL